MPVKPITMHERIQFITHQGKKIPLVDFSKCGAAEVERIARAVPDYVTVEPRGSVLILTDFTKSALIGTESLPRDLYEGLTSFARRGYQFSPVARKLWRG